MDWICIQMANTDDPCKQLSGGQKQQKIDNVHSLGSAN